MISRVADHCFWLGRYLERAESTARLLQVTESLAVEGDLLPLQCWQPVLITEDEEGSFIRLRSAEALADGEAVQEFLCFNPQVHASLLCSIGAARENARSIRETISLEAWESINELHLWMQSPAARASFDEERYGFYRHIRREVQLCLGLLRGTMLQDLPLDFIWLGVVLERTGQTSRILDVHHHAFTIASEAGEPVGSAAPAVVHLSHWLSLLRACYGFEPFMKTHHGPVTGQAVARFLLFEQRFPRSVRHCLRRARETLARIRPASSGLPVLLSFQRLVVAEAWLEVLASGPFEYASLHEILTRVIDESQGACNEISLELLGAPPVQATPEPPAAAPLSGQSQSQTQMSSQTK